MLPQITSTMVRSRFGIGMAAAPLKSLICCPGRLCLIGCGTGASAIPAAIRVGPNGRVIGIDLAERLLDIARAKSIAQKLQNIKFRKADMAALSYQDDSFDAVVCVFAIFFVSDMVKQVRELLRPRQSGRWKCNRSTAWKATLRRVLVDRIR
jgi:ubiquinone/menaquinone biosynthesis C-methylase UbiE